MIFAIHRRGDNNRHSRNVLNNNFRLPLHPRSVMDIAELQVKWNHQRKRKKRDNVNVGKVVEDSEDDK